MNLPEPGADMRAALGRQLSTAAAPTAGSARGGAEYGPELDPPLAGPRAVAARGDGWLFVLDRPEPGSFRVSGLLPGSTKRLDLRFRKGSGDEELLDPVGLAVDAEGQFCLADAAGNAVKRYSTDGRWLATFAAAGFDGAPFDGPRDVVVDPAGTLYIADTNNHRIVALRPDGELLWVLERFPPAGGKGPPDEFCEPWSVAADGRHVAVADTNQNRVLLFDAARQPRGRFEKAGPFELPSGVRFTRDGMAFYAADLGNRRIRRLTLAGAATTMAPAERSGDVVVSGGAALDVTAAGELLLADPRRNVIRVVAFTEG